MKLSSCGLDCETCEAFIANQTDDDVLRATTAEKWSKAYGVKMNPEDINCTGCRDEGAKIGHCNVCEIRKCNIERNLSDCGKCDDITCDKLEAFFEMFPDKGVENLRRLKRMDS